MGFRIRASEQVVVRTKYLEIVWFELRRLGINLPLHHFKGSLWAADFTVHAPPANLVTTRNILAPTECEWLGDVYMKCYVFQGRMYQELDGYRAITAFAATDILQINHFYKTYKRFL